ncbi:sigma-70 family RNA polymerase sigma factor [bacterium]|nr:sigma-70 family RNA polymerase sigma factor [bacterium]
MSTTAHSGDIKDLVDDLYRREGRRIFATLVRLVGDFELAEEAMQEAFSAALESWQKDGVPKNPRAWLVSTGRFKAIDSIRRRIRFDKKVAVMAQELEASYESFEENIEGYDDETFNDDLLRLVFTCCHPALASDARVALTLREICGLTTEEIASAFLTSAGTIAQRIVSAKAKIRDTRIPYIVPSKDDLPERLDSVLAVIYLVFNEGYSASSGAEAVRVDLSSKAIHLGRMLNEILKDPEVSGLLALMLLHESRREARVDSAGDLILLEDQDRSLWKRELIEEGSALVEAVYAGGEIGVYSIQAAISAVHARAKTAADTEWGSIVALYDLLLRAQPSSVVALNRAVAISMRDGPESGLDLIEELLSSGELSEYHLSHAARADMLRRLGKREEAAAAYKEALTLARQEPERRFLERRLKEMSE